MKYVQANKDFDQMHNKFFRFKQFTIHHDRCAMKVGTDGVLLGAWINIDNSKKILDIGTGSGLIAIMLGQRSNASIEAIEIDQSAFTQATENISNCLWNSRILVQNISLQEFTSILQKKFDLIVCNPPFFEKSLKSSLPLRNMARHDKMLTHSEIIGCVVKILNPGGRFGLIIPYTEGIQFIAKASKKGLFCIRKTSVKTKPHSTVKRLLMEFSTIPEYCLENSLIITGERDEEFSKEYKDLTKDFYLNF
jgi:tRNA1Val (adenine37-N6)-methyltransferase